MKFSVPVTATPPAKGIYVARFWFVAGGALIAADFAVGPFLQLNYALAIPVFVIAWHRGPVVAWTLGLIGASVRLATLASQGFPAPETEAVMSFCIRLIALGLLAWLSSKLASHVRSLHEYIGTLERNRSPGARHNTHTPDTLLRWLGISFAASRVVGNGEGDAQAPIAPSPFDASVLDRPLPLGDRLRLTVMRYVSRHPKLVWLDPQRPLRWHVLHEAHSHRYDLIVDGYPRSGNSFFAMAFKVSNPQVRVRSHCHWPTHVIAALGKGKPACVLIRLPEDAIASTVVHTGRTLAWATRRYIDYYEALLPYRDRVLVVTFDQATTRLPDIFEEVNRRFGLTLNLPVVDAGFRQAVEEQVRGLDWGQNPLKVSLPSPARAPYLEEIKRRLQAPGMAVDLHRANELYVLFATCPTALGRSRRGV